jgi:hypothetical protein
MWLLDTTTLKLRHFITNTPDYVILSHTWGDGEVSFDDIAQPYAKNMPGYAKIARCCAQALRAGFEWAWVDTCCIDKRSSAELSEAINSMYNWYWSAAICYALISDHSVGSETFQSSRWFKRGWTLQELLAPDVMEFYDSDWNFMGTKSSLLDHICAATNIDKRYLLHRDEIENATIAAKFSWASLRTTTREEDMAYCLLGLVHVNMPMLYGEGRGAFYRLQQEIIKQTNEHTIFAWESTQDTWRHTSIFAPSPAQFMNAAGLRSTLARVQGKLATHEMTSHGLSITLFCIAVDHNRVVAVLNCTGSTGKHVGIWLECTDPGTYRRLALPQALITEEEIGEATPITMHVEISNQSQNSELKIEWAMRVDELPTTFRVHDISTGSRSGIASFYFRSEGPEKLFLLQNLILHEGEFVCFAFSIDSSPRYLCFWGLHKGRPWIDMFPRYYIIWTEGVKAARERFEAQTQDQPDDTQQSCFRDYHSCSSQELGVIQVLARRRRSKETLEWVIKLSTTESQTS